MYAAFKKSILKYEIWLEVPSDLTYSISDEIFVSHKVGDTIALQLTVYGTADGGNGIPVMNKVKGKTFIYHFYLIVFMTHTE